MQEAEFVRRTSSIQSVGSLAQEDYLSSNASMQMDDLDDLDDLDERLEQKDGPIDFDAALDRAILTQQFKRHREEEYFIDIASQLLSLVPPGKSTDKELDEMFNSTELAIDDDDNGNRNLNDSLKSDQHGRSSVEPNTVNKKRPCFLVEDETSFAENDQSWLMEAAPVVKSLTEVLDLQIYLTGDELATGNVPFARYGRPDIKGMFLKMKQDAVDAGDRRVAVCVSAPTKLTDMCRKACIAYSDNKVRFDFHSEVMSL